MHLWQPARQRHKRHAADFPVCIHIPAEKQEEIFGNVLGFIQCKNLAIADCLVVCYPPCGLPELLE